MRDLSEHIAAQVLELLAGVLGDLPDVEDFQVRDSLAVVEGDLRENRVAFAWAAGAAESDLIGPVWQSCEPAGGMELELFGLGNVLPAEEVFDLVSRRAQVARCQGAFCRERLNQSE